MQVTVVINFLISTGDGSTEQDVMRAASGASLRGSEIPLFTDEIKL